MYPANILDMQDFFKDLIVVELASILAGPSVGLFFAELGAKVIKVENAASDGDPTRKWKLPLENSDQSIPSAYYTSVNRGKESILLDLKNKEHFKEVIDIIGTADVLLTNFKKASAEALGLTSAELHNRFPRLIIGEIVGYTHKDKPAFDVLLQAESGYISMNGSPQQPAKMPVALIDILAGHQLKEGILCALLHLERTGQGSIITTSLYDSAIASLANQASNYLISGHVAQRMGTLHPNIAPYGEVFRSKDQVAFVLAIGTERQWNHMIELFPVLDDPQWKTNDDRLNARKSLYAILQQLLEQRTWPELSNVLDHSGIPASKISDLEEVLEDSYVRKRLVYEGGVRNVIWEAVLG